MPRRTSYVGPVDEKTIGRRLRELRRRRGMTQLDIAKKLGIRQPLVSQYERGELRLHGALVAAFAKVLRVTSDEILGLQKLEEDGFLKDRRFLRRLEQIDRLPKRKKQALLTTIDAYLGEQRR